MSDELLNELEKINRNLKIGIVAYIIFWAIVIALIHLVMIPAIR